METRDDYRKHFVNFTDEVKWTGCYDEKVGKAVAICDVTKNEFTALVRKLEKDESYTENDMALDLMMLMVCVPIVDKNDATSVVGFESGSDGRPVRIFEQADRSFLAGNSHHQGGWIDRLIIDCGNARKDFLIEMFGEKNNAQLKELAKKTGAA